MAQNSLLIPILIGAGALVFSSAYYFFPTYIYEFEEKYLYIRRYLFKFIPYGRHKIKLEHIEEIKHLESLHDVIGAAIWGRLFFKPAVIIKLKNMLVNRYYLTPDDPDVFIQNIKRLTKIGV